MSAARDRHARRRRAIWAIVGELKKRGVDGDDVKESITFDVSNGRTGRSSSLTEREHGRLLDRLNEAAARAGVDRAKPRRKARRPAAARGLPGLRTVEQVKVLVQLCRRQGLGADAEAAAIKACPSSQKAAAEIEKRKSQLVRGENLVERCAALKAAAVYADMSTREKAVITDIVAVAGRGGRSVNRLSVGGVFWALDILARVG